MIDVSSSADVLRGAPTRTEPVAGRLLMLSGFSFAVQAIPVPLVPERMLRRIRGAVVHETATRHGVGVTAEARAILATPAGAERLRSGWRRGLAFVARRALRRLGPIALAARGMEVYALGHLLDRYLGELRARSSLRLLPEEASAIRSAIEVAVVRAVHPSTLPRGLRSAEAVEDFRDDLTRWIDTALVTGATLPSYLQRRLDAAFDEAVAASPELASRGASP